MMYALVLNGAREDGTRLDLVQGAVQDQLGSVGWEVEALTLRDKVIAPCTGCFKCWTKTPGICVIDDYGREVTRRLVRSDLLVILTPVTFGGHSSEVKKALDRSLGIMLPYFMRIKGKIHHRPRYDRYPSLMAVGTVPVKDEELERTYQDLVERNAINAHSPTHATAVIEEGTEKVAIEQAVRGLLRDLGVME